jgi:hypothetical protein
VGRKTIPQWLKPDSFRDLYGTAKAVPLQDSEFFRKVSVTAGAWLVASDELGELCQVDVAAADDAHNFAGAALAGESGGDGTGSRTFSDDVVALGDEAHGLAGLLEGGDDGAGEEMLGEGPHAGEDGLASAAIDEAGLPVGKFLGRAGGEREGERGCGFGLGGEDFGLVAARFESGGDATGQAASAETGDDGGDVGEVLDDFETGRGVACDEGVIFKGMDEGAVHGGMGALAEGLPALIVRSFDDLAAETADGVELGLRGGFDHEDLRRDAGAASGEGHTLSCVAGADGPDSAAALVFREKADSVPGSTNFEGADGLQALELEPDFGGAVVVEADERGADGGLVDVLAGLVDEVGRNVSLGAWTGEWCWMGGHCEVHYTLVGGAVCRSEVCWESCHFGSGDSTEVLKSDNRM